MERTLSTFEFVLVLIAIVAGFAISEILSAWGRLIRSRANLSDAALYLAASMVLQSYIVRYVWELWTVRAVEWSMPLFMLAFTPMWIAALAAYVISIPRETKITIHAHYFAESRPFFMLMALFLVISEASGQYLAGAAGAGSRPDAAQAMRLLAIGVTLTLAFSRSRFAHAVLLAVLVGFLQIGSVVFAPRL